MRHSISFNVNPRVLVSACQIAFSTWAAHAAYEAGWTILLPWIACGTLVSILWINSGEGT